MYTTLVSTFLASIFTPAMTPPLRSVTRPVRVAVGPARREPATRELANNINDGSKPGRVCAISASSGMIGLVIQERRSQQLLTRRLSTAAPRFHGDKHLINLSQHIRVVELQDPAILRRVVKIENAETARCLRAALFLSPNLEIHSVDVASVLQIVRVEGQLYALCIKDASRYRAHLPWTTDVLHIHDAQIARGHQIADIF